MIFPYLRQFLKNSDTNQETSMLDSLNNDKDPSFNTSDLNIQAKNQPECVYIITQIINHYIVRIFILSIHIFSLNIKPSSCKTLIMKFESTVHHLVINLFYVEKIRIFGSYLKKLVIVKVLMIS